MKKIFLILILCAAMFACKKQNSEEKQKTTLISRSLTNGLVAYVFHYSADNKLTKFEGYNEDPPNALGYWQGLDYDASGNIKQITTYHEPGAVPTYRTIVETVVDGKIKTASNYDLQSATPSTPTARQTLSYSADGRLIKVESKDNNGKLITYTNLLYYADGSIKQAEIYKEESNLLYLIEKTTYSVPGTIFPKGLDVIHPILGPQFTSSFIKDSYQIFDYDQNGAITYNRQYLTSGREYSDDSTLTRQTITIKRNKPAHPDTIIYKQYEYIKQ